MRTIIWSFVDTGSSLPTDPDGETVLDRGRGSAITNRLTTLAIAACLLVGLPLLPLVESSLFASNVALMMTRQSDGQTAESSRHVVGRPKPRISTTSGGAQPTNPIAIDYLWPGEPPHYRAALRVPTWVDVPIVSGGTSGNIVLIRSLRIMTGARNWGFKICGSKTQPETCGYAVVKGWKLWYADSQANLDYQDLDGNATPEIHFLVTPFDGDWMSFRVQIQGELP